jgi:hypothetical protein
MQHLNDCFWNKHFFVIILKDLQEISMSDNLIYMLIKQNFLFHKLKLMRDVQRLGLGCLTPLSTIFQLYLGFKQICPEYETSQGPSWSS